jgi:DNA-binding protein YbaB
MEVKLNLNIEAAIEKAIDPETLSPIVEKAIKDAVKSAIEDATGYRSDFRKALIEQLNTAMPHGLQLDDVAKFQHVLNGAITQVVHAANSDTVQAAMNQAVKAVMPDVPARIKMSELIENARDGLHKEKHEAFYAYFEESEYGGGWLYLDSNEKPGDSLYRSSHESREGRKYKASIRLSFNKEGEVYALKLDGVDLTPAKLPNAVGSLDGLLLSMYVGRTSIEVDIDDVEVESLSGEQYD